MSDERLTVHVWNELPELRRLADIVDAYFAERNLPEPMAFQFNLALDEILTNIISYGYLDQERHLIEIDLRREDGSLWVEIIDDGRPFDPLAAAAPDINASIEQRRIGGLGIHLVKTSMDAVAYRRESDRNHLTLRKTIPGCPPAP